MIGAGASVVYYAWLVTDGSWDPFRWLPLSDLFDAQAHGILHGHLWMPNDVLGIEGFGGRGGRQYMGYWGPFPALLRLPLAATGDGLDGRLSVASMSIAYVVTLGAAGWIAWSVRGLVRPGVRLGRVELLATAGLALALGVGSSAVFLGSRAWVYHESIAWGLAASLLAFGSLLSFLRTPRRRSLAWASAWATAAMLSRGELGLGPVLALGLLALGNAAWMWRRQRSDIPAAPWLAGIARTGGGSWWPLLAAAAAVPVAAYMLVNWIKFGSLLGVPWSRNTYTLVDQAQRETLRANGGTIFGLQFAPTNLLGYLRPDGIRLQSLFPWIDFRRAPSVVGHVRFANLNNTASLPASMPIWVLLALRGAIEVVRPRVPAASNAALLRVLLIGALGSALAVVLVWVQEERYTADMVPLLLLAGLAGAHALLRRSEPTAEPAASRVANWSLIGALAIAFGWSGWVMSGLALLNQRLYAPTSPAATAALVDFQRAVNDRVPGHRPIPLKVGNAPPPWGRRGDLFVVGDCAGLYVSTGAKHVGVLDHTNWLAVERTGAVGDHRFALRLRRRPGGTVERLVDIGDPLHPATLTVTHGRGSALAFSVSGPGTIPSTGRAVHFEPGAHTLEVAADQRLGLLEVHVDDRVALIAFYGHPTGKADPILDSVRAAGRSSHAPHEPGALVPLPDAPPVVCRSLLAERR